MMVCVLVVKEMMVYCDLQNDIEWVVGRINGWFLKVGWLFIQFFFRGFLFEDLVIYYVMVDVMWIMSLWDGLNLVVKEYVVIQGMIEGIGVLVLFEFVGVVVELRGVVLVNFYDLFEMVIVCYLVLIMKKVEVKGCIWEVFYVVEYNDIR